jgi:hypothetical protein
MFSIGWHINPKFAPFDWATMKLAIADEMVFGQEENHQ